MRRLTLTSLVVISVAASTAASQQTTFRTNATLVVQTVTVLDNDGQPVEGLTADDFVVTEDGVRQALSFVEFQRLNDTAASTGVPPRVSTPSAVAPTTTAGIGTSGADGRYRNRRLLVLYFDSPGMAQADRQRALWSADRFIASQMDAADLAAIIEYDGAAVRVKQDFSDDRERLREVIDVMVRGNDRDGDGVPDAPADQATDFGQNGGEFNFLRTDRQLAALQTAISMLRPLPEQKALMYFVSGLRLSGLDNQAQLRATTNAAIRANVSINPIDARGLVAEAPMGGADVPSPSGIGIFSGAPADARRDRVARSQDTLYGMAKDTGGSALFDYNDLALGIRRAAAAVKSYYVLGYYSTRSEKDGRFRRVKVSVRERPSAALTYRQGYFAEKEFGKFSGADKERQLEDALMLGDPITEIPIAMAVNYFQINPDQYFVPVSVSIPGHTFAFDRDRATRRVEVDLIGEIKDERGVTAQNLRDRLEIPLTAERAAELVARPIQYETGFTLLPGTYAIKLLARDAASGRIGTFMGSFVVPNLRRETSAVRTSSVVLSSQRAATTDTLFSVKQKIPADAVNPLLTGGGRLLPSATRVFGAARELYVLFHVYRPDEGATGPLVAFVSLYKDGQPAYDSAPRKVDVTSIITPFHFTAPLSGLTPGRYDCQVSVLDLGQQKTRFWRTSIVVIE